MNELLKKSIRSENSASVEVKRYYYGLQKFNMLLIGGALLAALIVSYVFGEFSEYVPEHLNYKNQIHIRYEEVKLSYYQNGDVYSKPYDTFFEELYNTGYKKHLKIIFISHTVWLIPFLMFLFWRCPPPVRFDRKRRLIYTFHLGEFYSASFDQLKPRFPKGHNLHMSADIGPLEISLYNAKRNKEKRFRLGAHFAYAGQHGELYQWLKAYMKGELSNEAFITGHRGWLANSWVEKSLFQTRSLSQEKLDQALNNLEFLN